MAVAEKMAAIKLQVVNQMLLILALELKAISIRCGAIFKSSILTINLSMWIELGFSGGRRMILLQDGVEVFCPIGYCKADDEKRNPNDIE